jgi:hypothetical protein
MHITDVHSFYQFYFQCLSAYLSLASDIFIAQKLKTMELRKKKRQNLSVRKCIVHGKSVLKGSSVRWFLDYSVHTEMENKTFSFCPL